MSHEKSTLNCESETRDLEREIDRRNHVYFFSILQEASGSFFTDFDDGLGDDPANYYRQRAGSRIHEER